MKQHLTDKAVQGLKPEKDRYDVWDSVFTGGAFGVRVAPSGRKTFVAMTRDRTGKQRRLTVGVYPKMGLSEARQEARAALADLSRGIEPDDPEGPTFGDLAADFMKKHPKMKRLAPRTVTEYERILKADLLPEWGERVLADIKRADVGALLDRIAFERESPVMANRALALASVIFNFGIDAGRFGIEYNPCFRMRKRTEEIPRDRTLTDNEIRKLWAESGRRAAGDVYRLILLTGQRSGEVKEMRWADIEGDVWTIPPELAKNGRRHRVPLSAQTVALLEERRKETGGFKHVFHSRAGGPLRWLQKTTQRVQKAVGFDFRPHDLRRTCATRLAKLGIDDALIARILNHSWALNVTRRVYVVDDRLQEKRGALQRWADELSRLLQAEQKRKTG